MILEAIVKFLGVGGMSAGFVAFIAFLNHRWVTKSGLPGMSLIGGEDIPPKDELNKFGKLMRICFYGATPISIPFLAVSEYIYGWG